MKTTRLICAFALLLVLFGANGTLYHTPLLHADETPITEPGTVRCAVIFPFVTNLTGSGYDTGISIAGDASNLNGEIPFVDVYYFTVAGGYVAHQAHGFTYPTTDNAQTVFALSTENPGFQGYIVALTNLVSVKAACYIMHLGEVYTLADAPAILDYSVTGIGSESGKILRDGITMPEEWWNLDPMEDEIDPALHHTTLIFDCATAGNGYDTSIVITPAFQAEEGAPDATVDFYLFDQDGDCTVIDEVSLDAGVFPGVFLLSELAEGDWGPGWIVAYVNRPFCNGATFFHSSNLMRAGQGVSIDNNIMSDGEGGLECIAAPVGDHTSIVFPMIMPYLGDNIVAIANHLNYAVDVHLHLYSMDGEYLADEAATLTIPAFGMLVNTVDGLIGFHNIYDGWMVVYVDGPDASGSFIYGDAGSGAMGATRVPTDNDIIALNYDGTLGRAGTFSAGYGAKHDLNYLVNILGFSTGVCLTNAQNREDVPNPSFIFNGASVDGHTTYGPTTINSTEEETPVTTSCGVLISTLNGWSAFDMGTGAVETGSPGAHLERLVEVTESGQNPSHDSDADAEGNPVQGQGPDLCDVFDGQYDSAHPEKSKVDDKQKISRGAVTVANKNDTDGDEEPDVTDNDGVANEKDLIRVVIPKPAGMGANDQVKIQFTKGADNVEVWQEDTKTNVEAGRAFGPNDLPKVIWIEGKDKSAKVRDVELKITWGNKFDIIKMTFVWAERVVAGGHKSAWYTRVVNDPNHNDPDNKIPDDLNAPGLQTKIAVDRVADDDSYYGQGTFRFNTPADSRMGGRFLIEFTVYPAGVNAVFAGGPHGIVFNVAQQMARRGYFITSGDKALIPSPLGPFNFPTKPDHDKPNDFTSEDDVPDRGDHLYLWDAPSVDLTAYMGPPVPPNPGNCAFGLARFTFRDFVRIKFDGAAFLLNDGSRASEKQQWHDVYYLKRSPNDTWVEDNAASSYSEPIGALAKANGTCAVVAPAGAVTEGYTATYANNTWTVVSKANGQQAVANNNPPGGRVWPINFPAPASVQITITENAAPGAFANGDQFKFSVFKSAYSAPIGTDPAKGTCTIQPGQGAENDSYTAEYDGQTWKVTSDNHGNQPTVVENPAGVWTITFANQVTITITTVGGFNIGDVFEFSVFQAGANNGKRNEVGLDYYPVLGDP